MWLKLLAAIAAIVLIAGVAALGYYLGPGAAKLTPTSIPTPIRSTPCGNYCNIPTPIPTPITHTILGTQTLSEVATYGLAESLPEFRSGTMIHVVATLWGESAKELNRVLLSSLRPVERRTRLRAEWTTGGVTERFFDYVSKGSRTAAP